MLDVVRWLGVAFLTWYGVSSLLRARNPSFLSLADAPAERRGGVAGRAVALTWLNPHVYLDTVLLLGSIANQHGSPERWWFALGASLASADDSQSTWMMRRSAAKTPASPNRIP